jgi:hypothetical protein
MTEHVLAAAKNAPAVCCSHISRFRIPLRQQMWCKSYAPYAWDGCVPVARLANDRFPLIVEGSQTLDLSGFDCNLSVFRLASGWKVLQSLSNHRH